MSWFPPMNLIWSCNHIPLNVQTALQRLTLSRNWLLIKRRSAGLILPSTLLPSLLIHQELKDLIPELSRREQRRLNYDNSIFTSSWSTISMVDRQETESLKMIEKLIQNGKQYSEFVHQLWVPEHRQAYHYTCTRQSENVWSASSESGKTRRVEIRDDCSSCDCETFLSTLIPCRHICSAAITMRIDPFNVIYFTCTAFQSMFL